MPLGTGLEHCLILPQPVHNLRLVPAAAIAASPSLLGHQQLLLPWGIWGAGGRPAEGLAGCRVGVSTAQRSQSRLQGCRHAGIQGCRDAGHAPSRTPLLHPLAAPQVQHQEGPAAPAQQLGQLNINGAAPVPGTFLPCITATLKTTAWGQGLWQP